jgi:hypothetical protein
VLVEAGRSRRRRQRENVGFRSFSIVNEAIASGRTELANCRMRLMNTGSALKMPFGVLRSSGIDAHGVLEYLQSQHQTRRERIELCAPCGLPASGEAGQCAHQQLTSTHRRAWERAKAGGTGWYVCSLRRFHRGGPRYALKPSPTCRGSPLDSGGGRWIDFVQMTRLPRPAAVKIPSLT